MLADSDLNFHKKLMRLEYSQLYFHDSKFSCGICENIVLQKFRTIDDFHVTRRPRIFRNLYTLVGN